MPKQYLPYGTLIDHAYYIERWDERSQTWLRLANPAYNQLKDAAINASDLVANDGAAYRVIQILTKVMRNFPPTV